MNPPHSRSALRVAALGLCLSTSPMLNAQDLEEGAKLHAENCSRCHGTEVYTRPDHRVSSIEALNAQVKRCTNNLELQWFDDQVDSVVGYLNHNFYKF